jgi:hypothetical protein
MTLSLSPAIPLPAPLIYGWKPAWVSTTTLTVSSGQGWDSTFTFSMETTDSITIDGAVNGLNGLDTGSLEASKWYAVYVIDDAAGFNPPGCLLSLSTTAPVMPQGTVMKTTYSLKRQVGWIRTNGSSQFDKFYQVGDYNQRKFYWVDPPIVLSDGAAITQTAVSLNAGVPPVDYISVDLNAVYTPNLAENTADLIIANETSTTNLEIVGLVATKPQTEQVNMMGKLVSTAVEVDYAVTQNTDTLTLFVNAFDYQV